MKRNEFARLYFLSNEEILDILANAKNFKRIQVHYMVSAASWDLYVVMVLAIGSHNQVL